MLCGQATPATVTSLEQKMKTLPLLARLPLAWGLAMAYRQQGDQARVTEMVTYLKTTAPYCRALSLPPV